MIFTHLIEFFFGSPGFFGTLAANPDRTLGISAMRSLSIKAVRVL